MFNKLIGMVMIMFLFSPSIIVADAVTNVKVAFVRDGHFMRRYGLRVYNHMHFPEIIKITLLKTKHFEFINFTII